jgi:hypothetical protein
MSHNFVEQASGTWGCSQCGKTEEFLSDPARFVDGHLPSCIGAPGNELSHPVYFYAPPHMYLHIPLLFNELTPLFLLYTYFLTAPATAPTTAAPAGM